MTKRNRFFMKASLMVLTLLPSAPDWKPWEQEPDSAAGSAHGYDLVILRVPKSLHLCGYVDVSEYHPLAQAKWEYASDWSHPTDPYVVHGGITYSKFLDDSFRVGFDCAHSGDHSPGRDDRGTTAADYRALPYVKAQCESLAAQLALEFHLDRAYGGI